MPLCSLKWSKNNEIGFREIPNENEKQQAKEKNLYREIVWNSNKMLNRAAVD